MTASARQAVCENAGDVSQSISGQHNNNVVCFVDVVVKGYLIFIALVGDKLLVA